jgi:lipid II:glycine glycyltransferase (peptidoglycan interpeptide bridge formation enzyme)
MATIETDLKEIFAKFDQRFDRLEQRLDRMDQKLESLPRIEEKLDNLDARVTKLEGSQDKQIWTLIIAIVGAMAAAVIKFGFFPNP